MLRRLGHWVISFVVLLLFVAAGSGTFVRAAEHEHPIRLKSRTFVPAANVAHGTARQRGAARPASRVRRHVLIQFDGPVTRQTTAQVRAAGAIPLRRVPENTLVVAVPDGFDASSIPGARWIGTLAPSDKVSAKTGADLSRSMPRYAFSVVEFHPDVTHDRVVNDVLAAGGVAQEIAGLPPNVAVVPTRASVILALSQLDAVAWIYPASDAMVSGQPVVMCEALVSDGVPVANYATEGDGWDGPGRQSADLGYDLASPTGDVSVAVQQTELARARDEWSRYVAVNWHPVADPGARRSVTFLWGPTDHGDGYPFGPTDLAHTFFPAPPGVESLAGDVHFNNNFVWGAGDPSRYDIFSVALHELGHSLGLGHSDDPNSVMYPTYSGIRTGLAETDVETIETLYAPRDTSGLGSGWNSADIGAVSRPGVVSTAGSTVTVSASGADIWGTADAFTFASRPLTGDGDIVARVDSLIFADRWSKAGVMIRDGSSASASQAFMLVSGQKGLAFQRRPAARGESVSTVPVAGAAPMWVWLSRRGSRIDAYAGRDGGSWQLIGSDTIPMSTTVDAGVAVTSHVAGGVATAVFSNIAVTQPPAWKNQDIGAVGLSGQTAIGGSDLHVVGAGADIWGTADAFQFAWQRLSGDGEIRARVSSVQAIRSWSKAGVMIRGALTPGSPHAFMLVSAGKGLAFQRRVSTGGESTNTAGGSGTAPAWVRLVRRGNLFTAYASSDGVSWKTVGSDVIPMGTDVYAGLAVSSHTETARCTAVFKDVTVVTSPRASQSSTR